MTSNSESGNISQKISEIRRFSKNASKVVITPSNDIDARRRAKIASNLQRTKTASIGGSMGGGTLHGTATNMYSPILSTDFLELPQNLSESRAYYRHFYNNDPYVGQAIDLHTELPLSKIRLSPPKGKDMKKNSQILKFFENMVSRIDLLKNLLDSTREYYVIGEAFIFVEDTPVEVPPELLYAHRNEVNSEGEAVVVKYKRHNAEELKEQYIKQHYQGWKRMVVLPPDQVSVESYQFSEEDIIELIPDSKTASLIQRATEGDLEALRQVESIPEEVRNHLMEGNNIPLGTNPYEGSFVYHMARAKPSYQLNGVSIIQRIMRTLIQEDKYRQAQSSIASRAMTPKRLIWAEDLDLEALDELRYQVDQALLDPDYSIVTNFQVNWEEVSANDRILNLSGEYDRIDRKLFAGLGVTESMLTGESSYSGEKINIEIINNRYLLYRDTIERFVEEYLFKPIARKKGFVEYDEFGNEHLLYPKLTFSRLAVRDNRDTFDSLFNLYQKGSLPIDYVLEILNIDPDTAREKVGKDLFTVNDPTFNEAVRSVLSEAGRNLVTESDFMEKFVKYLKQASQYDLSYTPPKENSSRF